MALSLEEVTAISRRLAAEIDSHFSVVAVSSVDREAGRVELLITVQGCHTEPCVVMVNLPRVDRGTLDRELRRELTTAFRQHLHAESR